MISLASAHRWWLLTFLLLTGSLLCSIPFQKTLVLPIWSSPVIGFEYGHVLLTTSDFIALCIIFISIFAFFVNLFCNSSLESIFSHIFHRKMFHVKHLFKQYCTSRSPIVSRETILGSQLFHVKQSLPVSLLLFAFFIHHLIIYSSSLLVISQSLRIISLIILIQLFLAIPQRLLYWLLLILVILGLFSSIISLLQILFQSQVGLPFLGELSTISPSLPGIARYTDHLSHLRAYSTFRHPNISSYFILFTFSLVPYVSRETYMRMRLFHVKQSRKTFPTNVSRETFGQYQMFHVKHLILVLLSAGILLSFSRLHAISLLVLIAIEMFHVKHLIGALSRYIVSRETIRSWKMFHVKHLLSIIPFIFLLLYVVAPYFQRFTEPIVSRETIGQTSASVNVSRETFTPTRLFYAIDGFQQFLTNRGRGIGLGMYPTSILRRFPHFSPWMAQPIHNVPLLLFVELGVFGTLILCIYFYCLSRRILPSNVSRETYMIIFFAYFQILYLFFDHYPLTSPPGQLIFAFSIVVSIILSHRSLLSLVE